MRNRVMALAMALGMAFFGGPLGLETWGGADAAASSSTRALSMGIYMGNGATGMTQIKQVERSLGRQFSILHAYAGFNETYAQVQSNKLNPMVRNNSIILLSWAPGVSQGVLYDEIAKGTTDAYLREFARGVRAWQRPLLIRFAYEMNMKNMAWNAVGNGGPDKFKAAWRRIHSIFEQEGATNVRFVWCPHADTYSPNYTPAENYYPGDDVVDWIGLDGYNWGSKYGTTLDGLFKTNYNKFSVHNKPIMLAEVGSAADDKQQSTWLNTSFSALATNYPLVKAVVYFNMDFSKAGEKDWRFSARQDTMKTYMNVMQSLAYSGSATDVLAQTTMPTLASN